MIVELCAARQGDQLHSRNRASPTRSAMPSCRAAMASMASGYVKALAAGSNNEEAAYLFMQWATSPAAVAGARHAALHAARSLSAVATTSRRIYRALWPAAKDYLINLCECANSGGGRHDHARLAGLCPVDRPHVHRRSGAARIPRRRCRRRRRNGTRRPSASASTSQKAAYRAVPASSQAPTPTTRSRSSGRRCSST